MNERCSAMIELASCQGRAMDHEAEVETTKDWRDAVTQCRFGVSAYVVDLVCMDRVGHLWGWGPG